LTKIQISILPLHHSINIFFMYPPEIVMPMKAELTENGFVDCNTPEAVKEALVKQGTTLLMLNSVCGCSAGTARPGVLMALHNAPNKPTQAITSFAGFDTEAVSAARQFLLPYPPSSPCIALLKDGALVHMIERHNIEGRSADMIAANLIDAFNQHCN
jgi:putative YphP/YqiW family bacilliredoxin